MAKNRIAIVNIEKCKPNSPAYLYLKKIAKICARRCITVKGKEVSINEDACPVCFNNAKRTPDRAVTVVNCPTENDPNIRVVHKYGPNSFRLYELPEPKQGAVLGILGTNGIGKTTALKILSGRVKPNLGQLDVGGDDVYWKEIIKMYRGSALQNYISGLARGDIRVSVKPQMSANFRRRFLGYKVIGCLNDKAMDFEGVVDQLMLRHLLNSKVDTLSGGELQRFAIAMAVLRDADVYFFDECSSYLDVKQRLISTNVIGKLAQKGKYVVVIEHDLTILDYMSDYIQCLYGVQSAYGVVTKRMGVSSGINQFLAGNFKGENMRFRDHEISFKVTVDASLNICLEAGGESEGGVYNYPTMMKVYDNSNFSLNIEQGNFREGEIVCLLGQNGCGKSTFMNMLSKYFKNSLGISYKKQHVNFGKFCGTVEELLQKKLSCAMMGDAMFSLMVMKPLKIDDIFDLKVSTLSGGERQRLAIALCLGVNASVYLIDEPSADLDYEQRIITAKVIRKWIVNHLGKTCFLIEHDFLMSSLITDRVIVYEGEPSVNCVAKAPVDMVGGFNSFLKQLGITFRRDGDNFRPRINKRGSVKDREQKKSGNYYLF